VKTRNNVHPPVDMTAEEAMSAWWDCELDTEQHEVLVDDVLLSTDSQTRLLGYSLIGASLRGEHLETRDLAAVVSARLASMPDVPSQASEVADNVVPLQPLRSRRRAPVWGGAIAASLVAAMVGLGVWITQPANEVVQHPQRVETASIAPSSNEPSLGGELPVSVSVPTVDMRQGLRMVSDSQRMPAWAQSNRRQGRIDPYLMTHYEATAPQFGDVMPSARMTSFDPE